MSRAFTKESEPGEPRCPGSGCGGLGQPVARVTMLAHASESLVSKLGTTAFCCPNPSCAIGYFDSFGAAIEAAEVKGLPFPKEPSAAACACLGITPESIEDDARARDPATVRRIIAHAASPAAACAALNADGRPCVETVRRLFLRSSPAP